MESLPVDIVLYLLNYVNVRSIVLLLETSKNLLAICDRNDFKTMLISRLEYEGYIIPAKINDIICRAKYYPPKRISCIRKHKLILILDYVVYFVELNIRGDLISYREELGIDIIQILSYGTIDVQLDNDGRVILPYRETLCHNIINISDYGQQCLFTNNKGRNFMINNNKLTELEVMKDTIQKEQNLYLNRNGTIYLENKDNNIKLDNVIQLTNNRYALTLDDSIYKITHGGNATKANIDIKDIKQIEALGLYSGVVILTQSGSIYYYYHCGAEKQETISEEIKLKGIKITEIRTYFNNYFDRNILYALSSDILYKVSPNYSKYYQESAIQQLKLR